MQRSAVSSVACLLLLAQATFATIDGHPIAKVLTLLKDLKEKATVERQAEELTYAKFSSWCSNSASTLQKAVAKETADIDTIQSSVDSNTQQVTSLKQQIASLEAEIAKYEAKGGESDNARAAANELFVSSDSELEETIDAVNSAIEALKDAKSSTALVQLAALRQVAQLPLVHEQLSLEQRKALEEPAVTKDEILAAGSQASHEEKYAFKSGNVIELLKGLKTMFENERLERTKAETNSANAHSLAKGARDNAIDTATTSKEEKNTLLGKTQEMLNTAKGSLESTQADLTADTETLKVTKTTCKMRNAEWQERTALRAKEVKAMDAAVEILSKVINVKHEQPSNPVPPPSPLDAAEDGGNAVFIQVARELVVDPKARALQLLRAEAKKAKSQSFKRFTEEVAARLGGPFDEVNNMIQKMIFRLMAEQTDEDTHKNWCDMEVEKTNSSKTTKENNAASLALEIEDYKASEQVLGNEITVSNEKVASVTLHMQEITQIRTEGKEENTAALKDADDAQKALANAVVVLESFYKESGMVPKETWELLQKRGKEPVELPEEPATWSASYTGVVDPSNPGDGVIAVLKQVASDFAQMEADTRATEDMDQKQYQEEMKKCEIEKARANKESEMKTLAAGRLKEKTASNEKRLKNVNGELSAVNQYLKDLAPACMEGDSTYEVRKQARSDEVAALKEAQVILADAFKEEAAPASSFLRASARKHSF